MAVLMQCTVVLCLLWAMSAVAYMPLRPPSVPLVVNDPYFSIWSNYDKLTDGWPTFWSNEMNMALQGMVRVDGKAYRIMGGAGTGSDAVPAMNQSGAPLVLPTSTVYNFTDSHVLVTLTFLSPMRAEDPASMVPLTFLIWDVTAIDGAAHGVQLYFDFDAELCVNALSENVIWGRPLSGSSNVQAMAIGTLAQRIMPNRGGSNKINWGQVWAAYDEEPLANSAFANATLVRAMFAANGTLPVSDDEHQPRRADDNFIVGAIAFDLESVAPGPATTRFVSLGYNDVYSVMLDNTLLLPYWRRPGAGVPKDPSGVASMAQLVINASRDFSVLRSQFQSYDDELMQRLTAVGGEEYALVCALAYRQTLGMNKLAVTAPQNGSLAIAFSRESGSGDDILTTDVIIDSAPFFLLFSSEWLYAQLRPIMDFDSGRYTVQWPYNYASHDMGQYPVANPTVSQETMPLEETGNMLMMLAAVTIKDKSVAFAQQYWPLIERWADYLVANGLYPANQLSSDDFDGPIANRSNLALKAIIGIGAFGQMCSLAGDTAGAAKYAAIAKQYAQAWIALAKEGDHFKLAYQVPGSWELLYNLWWDDLLGLGLFSDELVKLPAKQFYDAKTANDVEFAANFAAQVFTWVNETPDRWPMTDWYDTVSGDRVGFEARSMWGGIYSRVLTRPSSAH